MGTLSIICVLSLVVVSISTLPIKNIENVEMPKIVLPESQENEVTVDSLIETTSVNNDYTTFVEITTESDVTETLNAPENLKPKTLSEHAIVLEAPKNPVSTSEVTARNMSALLRNNVRPGMTVTQYDVEITPNLDSRTFHGKMLAEVLVEIATRDDPMVFLVEDLDIQSVEFAEGGATIFSPAEFDVDDDGFMEITASEATRYSILIEYEGTMGAAANGMFAAMDDSYIGMNLHPTHARRVFPCIDELTEPTIIKFSFIDVPFSNLISNSMLIDGSSTEFSPLQGPPHLWGMVAHNFNTISIPTSQVRIFGRSGLRNPDAMAASAVTDFFRDMQEWTQRPYFEIIADQQEELSIFALPDTSVDWNALSTICIWEPLIFMDLDHSIKQRKDALATIAQSIARQWYGYMVYPENWRHQWVVKGLETYAAYELLRMFQDSPFGDDASMLDINTLFVTDVIQESLLRDGYTNAHILDPGEDLFDEPAVRDHINGLIKYKAPAMLRMLRLILGREEDDFIQTAAAAIIQNSRGLQTVNTNNFYDAINGYWRHSDYQIIDDLEEFLEPWVTNRGYPVVHIGLRQGGVLITQEHFGFTPTPHINYLIPLTFTTSINPNFDDENVYNIQMTDATTTINMVLDEDEGDFVLFNLQGQGYYRVNYDGDLWERIIEALNEPDDRNQIHPLNRATLVDDALNLARAGKLDYDIAFQVVLSMEHELEYAVWKAFVRNMNFIKKRLDALIGDDDDDDLDADIYLRMVRRTVGLVEDEIGFYPDPFINEPVMQSLTRGLVMEHACRANYQPCIAAAVDWFYDPNDGDVVNPNIPSEIRPAVYCTMVKEGGQQVINALYDRLEIEESAYERVVILESLACSTDSDYINSLLMETIADNSPYGVEERNKIFAAIAESNYENARLALNFISMRTMDMRNMYGGPGKLEEMIYILAENIVNDDLAFDFQLLWVNNVNSNLDDSEDAANRALAIVTENLVWNNNFLDYVYEWIDDNDAPTVAASLALLCITVVIALFNH